MNVALKTGVGHARPARLLAKCDVEGAPLLAKTFQLNEMPMRPLDPPSAARKSALMGWWAVSGALGLVTLLGFAVPGGWQGPGSLQLDWQPSLAWSQPWRWWTPVAVHYSALHWGANLAGLVMVVALGAAAGLPARVAWAWFVAWPLTHLGLACRPELLHYGGLSGVLHAGVAVTMMWLMLRGRGLPRLVGGVTALVVVAKVLSETPWGPVLQYPAGWDIAVAPWAHATGVVSGCLCGALASLGGARAAG